MLYYKFTVECENIDKVFNRSEPSETSYKINIQCQILNEKQDYNVFFFVSEVSERTISLCAAVGSKSRRDVNEMAFNFATGLGLEVKTVSGSEILIRKYAQEAHRADRRDYIDDEDITLSRVSLGTLRRCTSDHFSEEMLEGGLSYEKAIECAKNLHFGTSLVDEINRIYADVPRGYYGHPVHYILQSDNETICEEVSSLLVRSLISVGRLKSRRLAVMKPHSIKNPSILDLDEPEYFDMDMARILSFRQGGGAFVSYPGKLVHETERVTGCEIDIKEFSEMINECREDTLSVIVFGKSDEASVELLQNTLQDICFVTISDNVIFKDEAVSILKDMAESKGLEKYDSLLSILDDKNQGYYVSDLERVFRKWNENRLRNEIYTQYTEFYKPRVIADKPKGDAYQDFQSLIGLKKAKAVVQQAIDFNKVRKLYKNAGIPGVRVSRHMVFTGNPGTAKTTVARLFAQIMKDNEILPVGKLIEVGRQDLVGKYVGWTAPLVEQAFKKAKGSVLFIDEAYSLCEERDGMYGDEAINAIVQLMENQRDDTIVILAGYPDKMEDLLNKNPGLRSRITFHVNFDDYDCDELISILHLMAGKNSMTLTPAVDDRVRAILEMKTGEKDFGNGRFVRNLFEQALMKQASRLVSLPSCDLDENMLKTLDADDFGKPEDFERIQTRREIGFAC